MAMKRCDQDLHFYDPEKNPGGCPYCRDQDGDIDSTRGLTEGIGAGGIGDETDDTVGIDPIHLKKNVEPGPTRTSHRTSESDDVTVGYFKKKAGFEPVVGWLVCTEGPSKGKDYRIKPGINEVGRDASRDVEIVITDDRMIARRDHAELEYDADENEFYLIRKKNPSVKLNGKSVRQPTQLKPNDVIQFGESVFIFIPLCTESFKWVID